MKVRITFSGKAYDPGDYYENYCEVYIDNKSIASGMDFSECPEDANLGRDLSFIYNLPKVLQQVYEAGKRNE